MAQILPQQGSLGQTLGTALGTGIGSALQNLASLKLNQLQQRQERDQFARLLEQNKYSPEQAQLISALPADQRLAALQSLQQQVSLPQIQESVPAQIPEQELSSVLQQMETKAKPLSGLELLRLGQQEQLQKTPLGKKLTQEQVPLDLNLLNNEMARQSLNLSPDMQNRLNERIQEISKDTKKQEQLRNELNTFLSGSPEQQQKQLEQLRQPLFKKPLSESERIARERLELKKQEMSAAERREAFKITQATRKEINDKAKEARRDLQDLDRLEELEKEGKLNTPGYVEFLQRSGFDIPALMEPGSQEYNKIVNNFVRGAKSVFAGRITNQELENYMRTLPSLSMSPEGRKRVIANLRMLKQGDVAYSEALRDIIKENRGTPPLDLSEQLEDRVSKKLDKIAINFRKNLLKEVPKEENKLAVGLGATLGGLIGAPSKLLSTLGGTAKIASFIP